MTVQSVGVSGSFEINDASPNYRGGGTTTASDLVTYSLTFTNWGRQLPGTPANQGGASNFNMTYSSDLSSVVSWSMNTGWDQGGGGSGDDFQFGGNNTRSGGFAQTADQVGSLSGFAQPAPVLTANLLASGPAPVPLPSGLPLLAAGLGLLALLRRRWMKPDAHRCSIAPNHPISAPAGSPVRGERLLSARFAHVRFAQCAV